MKKAGQALVVGIALMVATAAWAQDERKRPKIPVGDYKCRVSKGYKLRHCEVTEVDGRLYLTVSQGNLIAMRGELLTVDGRKDDVYFVGEVTDERPFGCYSCQARCSTNPGSCACTEVAPEASAECMGQQLNIHFKRKGNTWTGTLPYRTYWNVYQGKGDARRVVSHEAIVQLFEVVLKLDKKK